MICRGVRTPAAKVLDMRIGCKKGSRQCVAVYFHGKQEGTLSAKCNIQQLLLVILGKPPEHAWPSKPSSNISAADHVPSSE